MRSIAYTDPFVPAEWIAAHGLRPLRLRPDWPRLDDDQVPSFGVCPFARAFVGELKERQMELAGGIFTTVCDQMRRAAEGLGRCRMPRFILNVPATWQTPAAIHLYQDELKRLGGFLVHLGGRTPTEAQLIRCMLKYEEIRKKQIIASPGKTKLSLVLVGGPLMRSDEYLFDVIERLGGRIVLDGSETGTRTWPGRFNRRRLRENPLRELARAYFEAIPDISRRPNTEFYRWLQRAVAKHHIKGFLIRRFVWCDRWAAEVGRIKEICGLPVLDLDAGDGEESTRLRTETRLQAFLEMLR